MNEYKQMIEEKDYCEYKYRHIANQNCSLASIPTCRLSTFSNSYNSWINGHAMILNIPFWSPVQKNQVKKPFSVPFSEKIKSPIPIGFISQTSQPSLQFIPTFSIKSWSNWEYMYWYAEPLQNLTESRSQWIKTKEIL